MEQGSVMRLAGIPIESKFYLAERYGHAAAGRLIAGRRLS
jgi:hypothetical protein